MTGGQLVKAAILPVDPPGDPIECLFNPREYTVAKTNAWRSTDTGTSNTGDVSFGGGGGATLSLELFFDTYLLRSSPATVVDVRQHTDRLWNLMLIDERTRHDKTLRGRPPEVVFQWGATWLFRAVVTGMRQQFTMFLPSGTPVRATVTLDLRQTEDRPLMPPTAPASQTVRAGLAGRDPGDLRTRHGRREGG